VKRRFIVILICIIQFKRAYIYSQEEDFFSYNYLLEMSFETLMKVVTTSLSNIPENYLEAPREMEFGLVVKGGVHLNYLSPLRQSILNCG